MSQNENKLKRIISACAACSLVLLPSLSQAAIPARFIPAYTFILKRAHAAPVAHSVIPMQAPQRIFGRRQPAAVNRAAIRPQAPAKVVHSQDGEALSPELIANFHHIKATEKTLDMAELIPMDMQPSHDSTHVLSQVADRSLTTFLNSQAVKESTLGKTATAVQQKMKQEVVLGDGSADSVQHKFDFNVQAFQALAQVQYTGLTNAALKYKVAENKVALEVFEKIAQNKDFVVSHSVSSADQISEVSFRWNF